MTRSRCAFHPSRPAPFRCKACGKALCELCATVRFRHVYCGWRCALCGTARIALGKMWGVLALPVPAPWALAVVAVASALLLAGVGTHTARLLELSLSTPAPTAEPVRPVRATLLRDGGRASLEITGPPRAAVLVIRGRSTEAVVELDADGRGRLEDLDDSTRPEDLRLFLLGRSPAIAVVTPTPTPTPTATVPPSPTPVPSPTSTPMPTATATPTATPTPTPALRFLTQPPTPAAAPWPPLTPPAPALHARPSPTATPTPSPTATPTSTPTATPTPKATLTPIPRPTATPTPARGPRAPTPSPGAAPRSAPPVLELVRDGGPRISLTFDGGSRGNGADAILDRLAELDVNATLFLTGRFIRTHPEAVRRAVLEGHEVGNHTLTHPHLTTWASNRRHDLLAGIDRDTFAAELLDAERLFLEATGRPMAPLWRAPYGEENATLRRWAAELGYLHVRWSRLHGASLDARDWVTSEHSPLYEDADTMVARLLAFPKLDGGIVLLHLGSHRERPAWERLPELIDGLRDRDLEIVPVTELLNASPTWSPYLRAAVKRHRGTVKRLRGE